MSVAAHENQLTILVNSSDSAVGTPCISGNQFFFSLGLQKAVHTVIQNLI